MELTYINSIEVEDYMALRASTDWMRLCREQSQRGLSNSAYKICCKDGIKPWA